MHPSLAIGFFVSLSILQRNVLAVSSILLPREPPSNFLHLYDNVLVGIYQLPPSRRLEWNPKSHIDHYLGVFSMFFSPCHNPWRTWHSWSVIMVGCGCFNESLFRFFSLATVWDNWAYREHGVLGRSQNWWWNIKSQPSGWSFIIRPLMLPSKLWLAYGKYTFWFFCLPNSDHYV